MTESPHADVNRNNQAEQNHDALQDDVLDIVDDNLRGSSLPPSSSPAQIFSSSPFVSSQSSFVHFPEKICDNEKGAETEENIIQTGPSTLELAPLSQPRPIQIASPDYNAEQPDDRMAGVLQGAKACKSEVSSGSKRSLEVSVVAYTLRSPRLTTPHRTIPQSPRK